MGVEAAGPCIWAAEDQGAAGPDHAVGLAEGVGVEAVVGVEDDGVEGAAQGALQGSAVAGLGPQGVGVAEEALCLRSGLLPGAPQNDASS